MAQVGHRIGYPIGSDYSPAVQHLPCMQMSSVGSLLGDSRMQLKWYKLVIEIGC